MDATHDGGFHGKDGLYFKRHFDGTVTVWAPEPIETTFSAEKWASIVAGVSGHGEGHDSYQSALGFHLSNGS